MYPNLHPPGSATFPTAASYVGFSDQPGVDETNHFFDFDSWDSSSINKSFSIAPCDTNLDIDGHVSQPYGHPTAPVHGAREPGRGFESEHGNLLYCQEPNLLSVDTSFSDLGLGQDGQLPATFDASFTLEGLNTLDKTMVPNHFIAVDGEDLMEDIVASDNCNGLNYMTATDYINFAENEPMAFGPSHTEASSTYSRVSQQPIDIASHETEQRRPLPSVARKSKRTHIGTVARKVLDEHFRYNPYPGEEETSSLVRATQLTRRTISTWFSNTRARKKTDEPSGTVGRISNDILASQKHASPTQSISRRSLEALDKISPTASLNSLQRYLETPAVDDSVSIEAAAAIADTTADQQRLPSMNTKAGIYVHETSSIRALSIANSDRSYSSTKSWTSQISFMSTDSRGSRRGRKRWIRAQQDVLQKLSKNTTRPITVDRQPSPSSYFCTWPGCGVTFRSGSDFDRHEEAVHESRPFVGDTEPQPSRYFCTWPSCSATFRFRFEWARHEEAIHYQPYHWICCLEGTEMRSLSSCFVCQQPNVTVGHVVEQHFASCRSKSQEERTFLREDQFLQHIKFQLKIPVTKKACRELLEIWKSSNLPQANDTYKCGFCGRSFFNWAERQDHVFRHLEAGIYKSYWWPERRPVAIATAKPSIPPLPDHHSQTCHNCGTFFPDSEAIRNHSFCSIWSCRYLNDYLTIFNDGWETENGKAQLECSLCEFAASADQSDEGLESMVKEHADTHALRSCQQSRHSTQASFADHLVLQHSSREQSVRGKTLHPYLCQQQIVNGIITLSQPTTRSVATSRASSHYRYFVAQT